MSEYKGVTIYAEVIDGKIDRITEELLGCGERLARNLDEELYAVLMGKNISHLADEIVSFGADRVYVVDNSALQNYITEAYVYSMMKVVEKTMPRIILFGQTAVGQDLSPRLAFRLGASVVLDCVELSIDPESKLLLWNKPVYGGKAMATFTSEYCPQMATVRPRSMPPSERDESRKGEVELMDLSLGELTTKAKVIEKIKEEAKGAELDDAEVIICGGRGIGGAEKFKELYELTKRIPGCVLGATRASCDAGWAPTTIQIGLTGKIVAPNLYIAVALSGASQHMAGCSNSDTIVAINKDPDANIFKEASFGVVGDWNVILPNLIRAIEELSGN